jgi:hypothetical protein
MKIFGSIGRGLDKGLTGIENFAHRVQDYFLNYNIRSYQDYIFQDSYGKEIERLPKNKRDDFWRMVSYRQNRRW